MERYFVHNLETDKLNVFTGGKSDWLTIPEADRERIKSACLWSRSINGWVSRGKGESWNVIHLKTVLAGLGFESAGGAVVRRAVRPRRRLWFATGKGDGGEKGGETMRGRPNGTRKPAVE